MSRAIHSTGRPSPRSTVFGVGVSLHSDGQAAPRNRRSAAILFVSLLASASVFFAGCGNTYRPVVSAVNPVGPAAQPQKFAIAISNTSTPSSPSRPGLVNIIDFSGDDILNTTSIGANPQYLQLDAGGFTAYTLNGDGTTNSFGISTSLLANGVTQTTLPPNAGPVAVLPQGGNLYIAEAGLNSVAQLTQSSPPAFRQNLPTGPGTVYIVGVANAPRVYAISQGTPGAVGTVAAIETSSNTVSSTIPVGRGPVYGVMSGDQRRAFILNKTDGTVSVINAQTNAPDSFPNSAGVLTGTIPVGVAPVWADFAPSLTEMLVANQGNGSTPGSVSVISIPLCSNVVTINPNCLVSNAFDAVGFGQVVATITVGINPVMIAVLQDGSQAFVANQGNAAMNLAGSVSVINLMTNTVVATIPAGSGTNPLDSLIHGHPSWIAATTGTPTGKVYITSTDSTDVTILRTDTDTIQTHLPLQGAGIAVRVSGP